MRRNKRWLILAGTVAAAAFVATCAEMAVPKWDSRAIPQAQGVVETKDGKTAQSRYTEGPFNTVTDDFSKFRTYAYGDQRPEVPLVKAAMPKDLRGDAAEGRRIFLNRALGPCTGCHLIRGADVWPAGNIGPDLSISGDTGRSDEDLYRIVYDARTENPETVMPPWGSAGVLNPQQIVHLVAFLKTQKGPLPAETDRARDPNTRPKPIGFGDNLDPTNNPAILLAEDAIKDWRKKGANGKACADCHQDAPEKSMQGVGARYPRFVAQHGRMMALEDFLSVHAPETTGTAMPSQSAGNVNMSMLIKMQSNGMALNLDLTSREARASLKRGEASFNKRVGQRNHSCADCHTEAPGKGANKFLGGRLLADAKAGMLNHFPAWRTNFSRPWDPRKRFQWCMLPLGMNYLAADSIEYAELEFYVASFGQGKPLSVPGIRH